MKIFSRFSVHVVRMALLVCAVFLVGSAVLLWNVGETRAGAEAPPWETYAQHDATASYWLDDDLGPPDYAPQSDVDEQEHVY